MMAPPGLLSMHVRILTPTNCNPSAPDRRVLASAAMTTPRLTRTWMIIAAAAALSTVTACESATPSVVPTSLAPDAGIAACQAAIESYENQDIEVPIAIITGFKASANADLQSAGAEFERIQALAPEDQIDEISALIAAVQRAGTGCAAVGVTLPPDMLAP
jgi:hypothetical protein